LVMRVASFYTLSPVHNMAYWIDLAKQIEDLGSDSICIKDMAGLANILPLVISFTKHLLLY